METPCFRRHALEILLATDVRLHLPPAWLSLLEAEERAVDAEEALAGHSKIELTMAIYTDMRLLDLRGAVEAAEGASEASPRRRQA